jgi:transposase
MNATSLVSDDLWEAIAALLPKELPKPKGGRPRVPDRAALAGIIFVLRKGCPWRLLPSALGCGSGTTCWRRLRDWQQAGVWERLHTKLLNWLGDEAAVDWSRTSVASLSVRAKRGRGGRPQPGRSGQTWLEVPPGRGSYRHPTRRLPLGCQRPRFHAAPALGRRHPVNHRASRTTSRLGIHSAFRATKTTVVSAAVAGASLYPARTSTSVNPT